MHSKYRSDLDGLRALAVALVTLFHFKIHSIFSGGFLGVDVFFVLSGFFITQLIVQDLDRSAFSFKDFYLRRFHRLFPAFLFQLMICAAVAIAIFPPAELIQFSRMMVSSITSTSNIYLWFNSGYFDPSSDLNPLLHTWSLSVEEQFYLVWPLLFLFVSRLKSNIRIAFFLVAFIGLSVFAASEFQKIDPNGAFYLMPFRAFELALGALAVFILRLVKIPKLVGNLFSLVGLFAILGSVYFLKPSSSLSMYLLLIPCVGTTLFILSGGETLVGRLFSFSPLVYFGKISYSFYLFHWPIYVYFKFLIRREELNVMNGSIILALLIGLPIFTYHFIETPLRLGKNRTLKASPNATAWGLALVSFVFVSIGNLMAQDGFLWRVKTESPIVASLIKVGSVEPQTMYGGFDCPFSLCTLPTPSGAEKNDPVIVIGDSHSKALLAGFSTVALKHPVTFYEGSGCSFFSLDYVRDLQDPDYNRNCHRTRDEAFAKIKENPKTIVVLAQNWDMFRFVNGEQVTEYNENSPELFKFITDEIEKLVKDLKVQKFILLGNVPTTGTKISPLSCMSKPFTENKNCVMTPIEHLLQRRQINVYFTENIKTQSILVRDPYNFICPYNLCYNFTGRFPVYSDSNHLSKWGSQMVVERLSPDF